jgi:hypothetical protein
VDIVVVPSFSAAAIPRSSMLPSVVVAVTVIIGVPWSLLLWTLHIDEINKSSKKTKAVDQREKAQQDDGEVPP